MQPIEREIGDLLNKKFGEVIPNPKLPSGKRADHVVKMLGREVYFEDYDIQDITTDIMEIETYRKNPSLEIHEIPIWTKDPRNKKTLLDKIAGKILEECDQLPIGEPNVLVVRTRDSDVSYDNIGDVLMGVPLIKINEKGDMVGIVRHPYLPFRSPEEADTVFRRISALIAYEKPCGHDKLVGKLYNNGTNADVPLTPDEISLLEDLICDKCE
jgi:hypothetical protein